jgi:hypothetical protein
MNSSLEGGGALERMVDRLLAYSVSPEAVPPETVRLIALRSQALRKPAFPLSRVAAVVAVAALVSLFAATNLDKLAWLNDLATVRPFEGLLAALSSVGFEKAAAALAVTGGVAYTVYTIAFSRAR